MPQVTAVELKHGVSKKTGKPWTGFEVTLDDGRKASGFDQIKVGDHVAVQQNGKFLNYIFGEQGNQPEAPRTALQAPSPRQNDGNGVEETRKHLMQSVNLYNLCVDAVDTCIKPHINNMDGELYQAAIGTLFIEASHKRTNDGIAWWSYVDKMPDTPLKKKAEKDVPF